MPTLFDDIHERMEDWGSEGKMSPFKDIYELVFQMIVRMASCQELASNPAMIRKMSDLYWKLEKSATPVGLLFPWFPGTAKKNKENAINGLYEMLSHYVHLRREAEVPSLDVIDVLIADGMDNSSIVQASPFSLRSLFVPSFSCIVCYRCDFRWLCQHGDGLCVVSLYDTLYFVHFNPA
jgi:hypothetical protein